MKNIVPIVKTITLHCQDLALYGYLKMKLRLYLSYPKTQKHIKYRTLFVGISYSNLLKQPLEFVKFIGFRTWTPLLTNTSTTLLSAEKKTRSFPSYISHVNLLLLKPLPPSSKPTTTKYFDSSISTIYDFTIVITAIPTFYLVFKSFIKSLSPRL